MLSSLFCAFLLFTLFFLSWSQLFFSVLLLFSFFLSTGWLPLESVFFTSVPEAIRVELCVLGLKANGGRSCILKTLFSVPMYVT